MLNKNNKLVENTGQKKYISNFIVAPILTFIFVLLGNGLGILILKKFVGNSNNEIIQFTNELILFFLPISLIIFLWVKLIERRSIKTLGFYRDKFWQKYLQGFGLGLFLITLVIIILSILNQINITFDPNNFSYVVVLNVLIILIGWIVQGATEEIATRGWLMLVIAKRYGIFIGIFISSVTFALLHSFNNGMTILAVLNLFLAGTLFGVFALKTENLWGACGMHSTWNWAQGNIFNQNVSGTTLNSSSIFQTKNIGHDLLTGGIFGPEGGLVVTVVLLLAIGFIILKKDKAYSK